MARPIGERLDVAIGLVQEEIERFEEDGPSMGEVQRMILWQMAMEHLVAARFAIKRAELP